MFLIDANGRATKTLGSYNSSSLKEKLQSGVPSAATHGGLDITRPIFVYLDEQEEHYFVRAYREQRWVPLSEGQDFAAQTENLIPALKSISDEVNENHTNGNSRFLPVRAYEMQSEPVGVKILYGWYYLAIPQEIKVNDNNKVQVVFT